MYLHPDLKGQMDLYRLTKIYQWKDSDFTESSVFEMLRNSKPMELGLEIMLDNWISSLPSSIIESKSVKRGFRGIKEKSRKAIIQKLPEIAEEMESMIETSYRFSAYELEIKAVNRLGISFHHWLNLQPDSGDSIHHGLFCILPEEPVSLS